MKKISSYNDDSLREEQFSTLLDVINLAKDKDDIELFLHSLLSESESAYIGQRLNIMRMLAKKFNYADIKEKLNVSNSSISFAQKCLDGGGEQLKRIILEYKYKPKKIKPDYPNRGNIYKPKVHYPGSIL